MQIHVTQQSERDFAAAVQLLESETRKEGPEVIALATVSYTRGARNATPAARKNVKRKVVSLNRKGRRGAGFGVLMFSQHAPRRVVPVPAGSKAEVLGMPIARVKYAKAAKNSWFGVLRSLNKPAGEKSGEQIVSSATRVGGPLDPGMLVENRLSYLLKIAPHVDGEGKRKAAEDMVRKLDSNLARKSGWR